MSRVDALDAVVTSVGTKVGAGATAATATTNGEVNVSGTLIGLAQAAQGVVDLASKGLQSQGWLDISMGLKTSEAMWAKGVPLVGSGLGLYGIVDGLNPQTSSDYAGLVSNVAAFGGGIAALANAPVIATGLGVVAIGAGGYQIYQSAIDRNSPSSPLNTYNFGPNYRGNGFTDPRLLDASEGYRGLNTYSGVYASQAAENAAFENDWNTALNAYSMQPSYTSFPTDPAAYNGYADAFGGVDYGFDDALFDSDWDASWNAYQGSGFDSGGYYDYSYDSYDYGYYDYGDWYPLVIDLDGDGVEIKPLDRSTTTFDIDSDGYKERTAWVGADDGMLVIDLNGDNQITQSREMAFGEWTTEQDTDLQALAKVFDSNGDGTFDSRDARFNEFRIWKDANSNGVADAGEMMTLQAAGIAANDALYWRWANV